MSDERLVCTVDGDHLRFHWNHHPEAAWTVEILPDVLEGHENAVLERPLDENEVEALLENHLTTLLGPREFELEDEVSGLFALIAGFVSGALVASYVYSLIF